MERMRAGGIGVLAAVLACGALAQQAAFDKTAVLRELDKLEQAHRDKVAAENKAVADSLAKALLSPRALQELYQEAVFSTRFEGGKKDNTEFKKWKNAQDDTLKDDAFKTALELHAAYLNLTFLRASGEKEAKLIEALIQHVAKIWAAEVKHELPTRPTAELLERPVNQGVLARHLRLGPKLGGPQEGEKLKEQDKTWEWSPGNADGMLDRSVFPFLRTNKSPLLITLWDKRIAHETAQAKRILLSERANQFSQQALPKLNWRRAADLVLLGKEAEGLSTMIGILRQNPSHPDFDAFAAELRDLLSGG